MKTLLKWPGGKENELPIIRKYIPNYKGRYIEPFVGGGAVFFDIETAKSCINDKSTELINLYNCISKKDKLLKKHLQTEADEFKSLSMLVDEHKEEILDLYQLQISIDDFVANHKKFFISIAKENNEAFIKELKRNLKNKITRSNKLEKENGTISNNDRINNIEAALKSAYYMYIRYMYNMHETLSEDQQAAVFFFIREYCYSSMFRYNAKGDFNVPYGGISYNRKDFQKKIDYLFSKEIINKFNSANIYCEDFEVFLNDINLTRDDFIFLDPPYDTDFSTYSKNEFGKKEQKRLCDYLKKTPAKFLLVIKNTDYIYDLYKNNFNIVSFDKKYMVSFKNRNDRNVEHLLITNY